MHCFFYFFSRGELCQREFSDVIQSKSIYITIPPRVPPGANYFFTVVFSRAARRHAKRVTSVANSREETRGKRGENRESVGARGVDGPRARARDSVNIVCIMVLLAALELQ